MKSLRNILGLVILLGFGYFWIQITGSIYFDPLCKRYGEPLDYTYTDFSIRYRSSPAECYFKDANGHTEHVELREIPKQFPDYVRGAATFVLFMAGAGGVVALTKRVIGEKD